MTNISRAIRRRRRQPAGVSGSKDLSAMLYQQPTSKSGLNRRGFLQGLLGVGGLTALGLPLVNGQAQANPLGPDERILVLIHLDGGNDGLNTVIPFENGAYQSARGDLAIDQSLSHSIGDDLWLHPNPVSYTHLTLPTTPYV